MELAIYNHYDFETNSMIEYVYLSGTSGDLNININQQDYLVSFDTDLLITADNFVSTNSVALNNEDITVSHPGADGVLVFSLNVSRKYLYIKTKSLTGDIVGDFFIHTQQSFKWFQSDQAITADYTHLNNSATDILKLEFGGLALDHEVDKLSVQEKLEVMIMDKMTANNKVQLEDQGKWDLLLDEEKRTGTHWHICQKQEFRDEVDALQSILEIPGATNFRPGGFVEIYNKLTNWESKGKFYRQWTCNDRKGRKDKIDNLLHSRLLDRNDARSLIDSNELLTAKYVEGIVSQAKHGIDAQRDYYDSKMGTIFNNNGFREVGFTFRGAHTADSVADEILAIIDGD